uniref:Translocon-associated protein subunit gamma n=2 Tax=Laurasiatheria TaxID=314145 RepID=A0A9L0JVW6_EQUAS
MAPKGGSKQQSEEDLLLQDFSRNLSAKSSALFFGNAFIVSAIPIWLYWRIWHMDLVQSAVLYSVMTLVSTYLVAFAYKNVKFVLKHKVAQKREDAVSKEVTRKLSEADNRKMSRKEKDERILWKKNEVADYEATTFSIFYNNTLFLVLVIVASFFILKNFNPTVYSSRVHLPLACCCMFCKATSTNLEGRGGAGVHLHSDPDCLHLSVLSLIAPRSLRFILWCVIHLPSLGDTE